MSVFPLPHFAALSRRPPWSLVKAVKGLLFRRVCSPFTPIDRMRAGGCHARQVTLSPFYGLEVRADAAVIDFGRRLVGAVGLVALLWARGRGCW